MHSKLSPFTGRSVCQWCRACCLHLVLCDCFGHLLRAGRPCSVYQPSDLGLAEMFKCFTGPTQARLQLNPFHPLRELSYRQIDPFIPQRGTLRFSETAWQTKAWGDAHGQPAVPSPIHNLACLCHCRLPPWKPAVPGCAGELLAAMAAAYVMTPSVSRWQNKINILFFTGPRQHVCVAAGASCCRAGETERLSCSRMDEDYVDVIRTSKEKGITRDERIRNKRF